jgi:hypothetical protein
MTASSKLAGILLSSAICLTAPPALAQSPGVAPPVAGEGGAAATGQADAETPAPQAVAPRRLTLPVSLSREGIETADGRFRLGVRFLTEIRPFAPAFDMADAAGALVVSVAEASPAEAAGFLPGDMIVRFGGEAIEQPETLADLVARTPSAIALDAEIIRIGAGGQDLVDLLTRRADTGDRDAATAIGELAANDFAGAPDRTAGASWYRRAAEAGDGLAALRLAAIEYGADPQNLGEASRWYRAAAAAGEVRALQSLGYLYWNGEYREGDEAVSDDAEAVRLFRSAAEAGIDDAWFYLGAAYQMGRGVTADAEEARRWYEKAVAAGSRSAANNLGQMYYAGGAIARDLAEARRLFEVAAAGDGIAAANRQLGYIFRDGEGVEADKPRAAQYFRTAAEAGDATAMYVLGIMLFRGDGIERDAEAAVDRFNKAAEHGVADADYALALAYVDGAGVKANNIQAAEHLVKAIGGGYRTAIDEMRNNSGAWPAPVIAGVQFVLSREGFYKGKIDGRVGPQTRAAIDAAAAAGD